MKTIDSRIRKLEDRFCTSNAKARIWVVTNAACKLALDEDRCVDILDECGFLPPGPFGVVHLSGIPDGLNAKELEQYLRKNGAWICGRSDNQKQDGPKGGNRPGDSWGADCVQMSENVLR
jgi:hypothetical protein